MSLAPGTRLGVFEVISLLGAGGMGEVYRARDTKLGREVAIKVLPEAVRQDPERIARFEREAKSLAALNHPNIATLFGMEQAGARHLLVMEIVEGETLAEALHRGPMPTATALNLARQIAEALESAHERGIIHRDLKPANVKLTPDDVVKVLDFGLAKALESPPNGAPQVSQSPTLSVMATQAGMILGTAAYMSPEQAKGQAADHRSDVFAFGAVLYEMLTARPAFPGETVHDILASVIAREPDWTALPASTSPRLMSLLQRCLAKSRRQRWQAIGDVRADIEFIAADPTDGRAAPPPPLPIAAPVPVWRSFLPVAAGVIIGALAVGALMFLIPQTPPRSAPVTKLSIIVPVDQRSRASGSIKLAISPDGTEIVYVANDRLFRRRLSDDLATPILGTDLGSTSPVFSPDGSAIAFAARNKLMRVPVSGGAALEIGQLERAAGILSRISWSDGYLLVTQPGGLFRFPENGGARERLVQLEATESMASPQLLPGGKAVLFTTATGSPTPDWSKAQINVQPLDSSAGRVAITAGTDGRYLPTGHLVYVVQGVLFASRFDLATLKMTGAPVSVVEGVRRSDSGGLPRAEAQYAVSDAGSLAYLPGRLTFSGQSNVAFIDQEGRETPLPIPSGPYENPRISPDGKHLALGTDDGRESAVWVYDLPGGSALQRLTFTGANRYPLWSPDSQRLAFQSDRDGDAGIYLQPVNGTGVAERLTRAEPGTVHIPESWSRDGGRLSYSVLTRNGAELWMYSFTEKKAAPFGDVRGTGPLNSAFSRDDKWLAYTNRATPFGVFVQPVPSTGARYQVSKNTETGHHSFWAPDGKRLYYFGSDGGGYLVEVPIDLGVGASAGNTRLVPGKHESNTTSAGPRNYDVTPDGLRFVATRPAERNGEDEYVQRINVVINWFEELKRRVP